MIIWRVLGGEAGFFQKRLPAESSCSCFFTFSVPSGYASSAGGSIRLKRIEDENCPFNI